MSKVIFFRGRNTAGIIEDARAAGIDGEFVIVCRDGDALAEPGDIPVSEFKIEPSDDIIVVANGGTTAQAAPVIAKAAYLAGQGEAWVWVIEVDRDGWVNRLVDFGPAA